MDHGSPPCSVGRMWVMSEIESHRQDHDVTDEDIQEIIDAHEAGVGDPVAGVRADRTPVLPRSPAGDRLDGYLLDQHHRAVAHADVG